MHLSTVQPWLVPALLAGPACGRPAPHGLVPGGRGSTRHLVDTLTLRASASFLASDALLGRATGSEGGRTAAAYLASECRRLGFQPLNDAGYAQDLPLTQATIVPEGTSIRITGP